MEKNKKTSMKILSIIGNVVFYVLIAVLLLFSISNISSKREDDIPAVFSRGFVNVLSSSMDGNETNYRVNSFKKDALVFVKILNDESKAQLQVGDVVVFWGQLSPTDPTVKAFVIHRIIEIDGNQITTQGDNPITNATITETHNINAIKAVATSKVEGIGGAIGYLQSPTGFLIFVVVPLILLVVFETVILIRFILQRNKVKLEVEYALEKERLKAELMEEIKKREKEE